MQPYLRNTPKTYDFRNFLCKNLSDFVENYRKYTTKTQNQPSEQNFWEKKFSEKNLSEATHPQRSLYKRGYVTDLQAITHVYPPRLSTFVNKKEFFSTKIEFINLYKSKIS